MTTEQQTSPKSEAVVQKEPLLSVKDLHVTFQTEGGMAKAVRGVSFDLYPDEVLGIVGESGSGKSVSCLSIMRLIPDPPGQIEARGIYYRGENLLGLTYPQMERIRGNEIGMIFQEPMTALNPVFTIGKQVMETVLTHNQIKRKEAFQRSVDMLTKVGIPDAARRMKDYPHQFSGGMRQRVMIAMALVCHPNILIADEPTTALDVTMQAQILDLMLDLKTAADEDASLILITHDLAVVAETCERVLVMYGGHIQESGTTHQIFKDPQHPYTKGLLASLPQMGDKKEKRLYTIPGNVPSIMNMPEGCKFCTRCEVAKEAGIEERCRTQEPALKQLDSGAWVRCHLFENE